jgi:multidrug efflux pump subunit AcrA (membrane-fusion protein)
MLDRSRLKLDPKIKVHGRVIRATTYCVASLLAVLMLTAAVPPIVADQSDRAILNAPTTLLTTPIAGEVAALDVNVADRTPQGTTIAEVSNTRVDRTAMIALESRANNYREALAAAKSKKEADLHYVAALDNEISAQKAELIKHFEKQTAELKSSVDAAQAVVEEKRALRDREVNMVSRNVASDYMLKPTGQQLASAEATREAASQRLASSLSQLDAIKHDLFVGDNLVGIATLVQKRRDVSFDAQRQEIEQAEATAGLADEMRLVDAERRRLQSLADARLTSPSDDEVLHVGVALGRHVSAGDSVATLVDCRSVFAVAIFSYRQATALSVGTRMIISGTGVNRPIAGTVQEIMPKSSDKTDALYAVPFPQTERREMYVVVKPDDVALLRSPSAGRAPTRSCPVGKWVTVTRADGWVPSTSIVWQNASSLVKNALAAVFWPSPGRAQAAGAPPSNSR